MQGPLNPGSLIKANVNLSSIHPATLTADKTGDASVDCRGYEYALVLISVGTVASGGKGTFKVMASSDDGSSDAFAAISNATYALTGTDDNLTHAIEVRLSNYDQYLRVDYEETATGSSVVVRGCTVIPWGPKNRQISPSNIATSVV